MCAVILGVAVVFLIAHLFAFLTGDSRIIICKNGESFRLDERNKNGEYIYTSSTVCLWFRGLGYTQDRGQRNAPRIRTPDLDIVYEFRLPSYYLHVLTKYWWRK